MSLVGKYSETGQNMTVKSIVWLDPTWKVCFRENLLSTESWGSLTASVEEKHRLKQEPERGVGWAFTGEDVGEPPLWGTSSVGLLVKSLQPAEDCSSPVSSPMG